jgi:DNA modification methylase
MLALHADGVRVHLAYLDPPFNTGRDFAYKPRDGGPEEHAYSDKWPSLEAFVAALRERAVAVRELLTPDGCMVLHCDPQTSHYVKVMLDGVFGRQCYANEIVWRYRRWPSPSRHFQRVHDTILRYVRDSATEPRWNQLYEPLAETTVQTHGTTKQQAVWREGRARYAGKSDEESPGVAMGDVWEIGIVAPTGVERTGYPTQKPEPLLRRIIESCSNIGDTVLDPYCGSATSGAVAQALGRNWIGIDESPVAIRVASARLAMPMLDRKAKQRKPKAAAAGPTLDDLLAEMQRKAG